MSLRDNLNEIISLNPDTEADLRRMHVRLRAEPQFMCSECECELPLSYMRDPGKCYLCSPLTEDEQEELDAYYADL